MLVRRRDWEQLQADCARFSDLFHAERLKAVKAESLAEERKYEIERLEQLLINAGQVNVPMGGFVEGATGVEPESDVPRETPVNNLLDRLDEICGVGLSPEEIERRHDAYRRRQIDELEEQRREVIAELKDM